MSKISSKIAPPESLENLGKDIIKFAKTEATKEEIDFLLKELEEMENMVKEGLKKHRKK
ncbi:MAG: hypothetical protein AAF960_09010 [Bacteroidota bacterium]